MITDPHDLLGAYTLDALDDFERARFKAHLAGCRQCQAEISDFERTSAQLDDL
ncbi:MAG: zf-HC2 domain-containing protein [Aeromicrobium sp.]